jgi:hypothetical protein
VGGQNDAHTAVPELRDQLKDKLARLGIQARAGFVQEQYFRIADERGRQGEPLPLAAGQPADRGAAERLNAEPVHELIQRPGVPVHPGDVPKERQGTGRRREPAFLEHDAHAGPQVSPGLTRVLPQQGDGAARAPLQALGAFDGGGFACAVGSEERGDLPAACNE